MKASPKVGLGTAEGVNPELEAVAVVVLKLLVPAAGAADDVNGGLGRTPATDSALGPHSAFHGSSVLISAGGAAA